MTDAKTLWTWWQALLLPFQQDFTRPGWVRFTQWVTGMVLCWEEHTITQILTSMHLESRWRALEYFAAFGAFDQQAVEGRTLQVIEQHRPARWAGYHPVAVDDTKEHRTSASVWGTCTFHEPASRSPNRATTVRAHNWVVMGDLIPGQPWTYVPHAARLYFRASQLPAGETFCTKTVWASQLLHQADAASPVPILGVFDGAYANATVIGPCLNPKEGERRIDIVTRLRQDARLYHPLVATAKKKGRPRKWGRRLAAPQQHEHWDTPWRKGQAYLYGRLRNFQYKQMRCHWSVSGPQIPVHAFVFLVEGYDQPWFVVSSALALSVVEVVAVFAARFRQEDGFRDHKQRLGMEECRAWTRNPIRHTFTVQMVAQTLLRLLQVQLDAAYGAGQWWRAPDWNRHKKHPSVLDLRRLLWHYREEFSQFVADLEELPKREPEKRAHRAQAS